MSYGSAGLQAGIALDLHPDLVFAAKAIKNLTTRSERSLLDKSLVHVVAYLLKTQLPCIAFPHKQHDVPTESGPVRSAPFSFRWLQRLPPDSTDHGGMYQIGEE